MNSLMWSSQWSILTSFQTQQVDSNQLSMGFLVVYVNQLSVRNRLTALITAKRRLLVHYAYTSWLHYYTLLPISNTARKLFMETIQWAPEKKTTLTKPRDQLFEHSAFSAKLHFHVQVKNLSSGWSWREVPLYRKVKRGLESLWETKQGQLGQALMYFYLKHRKGQGQQKELHSITTRPIYAKRLLQNATLGVIRYLLMGQPTVKS